MGSAIIYYRFRSPWLLKVWVACCVVKILVHQRRVEQYPTFYSVLLFVRNTWSLQVENMSRSLMFGHKCFRNIPCMFWNHWVNNVYIRLRVIGDNARAVDKIMDLHRFSWLKHFLFTPTHLWDLCWLKKRVRRELGASKSKRSISL